MYPHTYAMFTPIEKKEPNKQKELTILILIISQDINIKVNQRKII